MSISTLLIVLAVALTVLFFVSDYLKNNITRFKKDNIIANENNLKSFSEIKQNSSLNEVLADKRKNNGTHKEEKEYISNGNRIANSSPFFDIQKRAMALNSED